jgi:hypothetical protein
MKIDCTVNIIDLLTLFTSIAIAMIGFCLSKKVNAKQKFEHEKIVSDQIRKFVSFGNDIILADVKKYEKKDLYNIGYRKQKVKFYDILPAHGVRVILMSSDEKIPIATIPFDWIEYIREFDSEDNRSIIVCKFKGIRYYKKYKSAFKEILYFFKNENYTKDQPEVFQYIQFKK